MFYFKLFILFVSVVTLINGCSKQTQRSKKLPTKQAVSALSSETMVLVNTPFSDYLQGDDLSAASLKQAIQYSISYLNRISPESLFHFGKISYTAEELKNSFLLFLKVIEKEQKYGTLIRTLETHFYLFQSSANGDNGVMFTGYYEPISPGSLIKTDLYKIPVYEPPDDLIVLDLGGFRESLVNRTIVYRVSNKKVLPYYTREQIMSQGILEGNKREIAWMKDPVDLFFMQVQGSGILELTDGTHLRLGYNGSNGRPYSSIGKYIVDEGWMELEDVSMGSIRQFIDDNPQLRDRILYHNMSYTFFKIDSDTRGPKGNINVPLTPNRSIATDSNLFPKGALAYIAAEMPVFENSWGESTDTPFARFVVNQDTGGAIKGTGRVDLFWGNGKLAEKSAGQMRSFGKLYFLIAKKESIASFTAGQL